MTTTTTPGGTRHDTRGPVSGSGFGEYLKRRWWLVAAPATLAAVAVTVIITLKEMVLAPPAPTTESGIETFRGGGVEHGAKTQIFWTPSSGIGPPTPENDPAPFWTVSWIPMMGN